MTELKTLNDMDFKIPGNKTEHSLGNRYIKSDLRQEAIKWIKTLNNIDQGNSKSVCEEVDKLFHTSDPICAVDIAQDWIKHFFNITAEDLK